MADTINVGTKQNAVDPENPQANEQLTATEVNEIVTKANLAISELNSIATGSSVSFANTTVNLTANQNEDITVGSYGTNARPWMIQVYNSSGQIITDNIYSPQWFNDGGTYKIRLKSAQALSNVVVAWVTIS